MDPNQRNAECRRDARRLLALRMPNALPVETIQQRLADDGCNYTADELRSALAVLVSLKQVETFNDPLGSRPYYRATAAGVLAHERNE